MPNAALDQVIHRLRSCALRHDGAGLSDGELLDCFVAHRDEAAFEALVRRHGPMVYGVCKRILRNDADADDAFQATFLVLVRKAASIRPRGMVSNWLYGVAHNTALKAKAMIQQRRIKENHAGTMPKTERTEEAWLQMQSLMDTELSLLPDKYRVPIVLCDLEGKTIKEAVHHLGWPQGTVASRLTRGRALLARRLSKHGLCVTAGLLAGALSQGAASASVPGTLTATTIQASCLFAAGKTAAAAGASATAIALADGVVKTMLMAKLKLASAVILVAALTAGIGGYSYHRLADKDASDSATTPTAAVEPVDPCEHQDPAHLRATVTIKTTPTQSHPIKITAQSMEPTHADAKVEPKRAAACGQKPDSADLPADAKTPKQTRQIRFQAYSVRVFPDGLWVILPKGNLFVVHSAKGQPATAVAAQQKGCPTPNSSAQAGAKVVFVKVGPDQHYSVSVCDLSAAKLSGLIPTCGAAADSTADRPSIIGGALEASENREQFMPYRIELRNIEG